MERNKKKTIQKTPGQDWGLREIQLSTVTALSRKRKRSGEKKRHSSKERVSRQNVQKVGMIWRPQTPPKTEYTTMHSSCDANARGRPRLGIGSKCMDGTENFTQKRTSPNSIQEGGAGRGSALEKCTRRDKDEKNVPHWTKRPLD